MKCAKSHDLVLMSVEELRNYYHDRDIYIYTNGYRCDICGTIERTSMSYHCTMCKYDICPRCAPY